MANFAHFAHLALATAPRSEAIFPHGRSRQFHPGENNVKNLADAGFRAPPASPMQRVLASQRRRLLDAFMQFMRDGEGMDEASGSILEVCAQPALLQEDASILLSSLDPLQRSRVTSCTVSFGGADCRKYQRADGRHLAYADGEFDWVFCGEIIEHAGSFERQYELLKELSRVARKGVFLTTANRWHPLEFRTALPLLHWLPAPLWKRLIVHPGRGTADAAPLPSLLGSRDLYRLASLLPGSPENDVGHVRLAGIKAHFFLMVKKGVAAGTAKAEKKAA
jgi:hypothetical protein